MFAAKTLRLEEPGDRARRLGVFAAKRFENGAAMKKIEDLNYYELLEISPTASAQEIHRAYERVKKIYEPNSIALYSLFTPEETAVIHQRIEEAYRTLVYEDNRRRYDATLKGQEELPEPPPVPRSPRAYQARPTQPSLMLPAENHYLAGAEQQAPSPAPKPEREAPAAVPVSEYIGEFTGPALKALREQRGLDLRACSDQTKVGLRYLEAIEAEDFRKLPVRPYLRGFLMLYARALGCDPARVAGDYLKRFEAATKPLDKSSPK